MSNDVVMVRSVRGLVGMGLRLITAVDEAAERVEMASDRARELVARLPVPRVPEER